MNAERYLQFLQIHINDFMDELPLQERQFVYFQQDGAPCHSTLNVREYLENLSNEKLFTDILDYFLWGYLKRKVYKKAPFQDVNHLERIILETCQEISPQMIRNLLREFANRTNTCMEREGGYVEALVE